MMARAHRSTALAICARLFLKVALILELKNPLQQFLAEGFVGLIRVIPLKLSPICIDFREMFMFNFGYLTDISLLAIVVTRFVTNVGEDAIESMIVIEKSVNRLSIKDLGFPKIVNG